MCRIPIVTLLLLLAVAPVAGARSVTVYLDGALVEDEATARKGYLELSLPAGMAAGSLRLKPAGEGRLRRVVVVPGKPDRKLERELAALNERRELVKDRLRALATREEIFKAAAKSQSGKAPRRSKTNPAPLSTIKQGTDYALAQLEEVHTARRRAEKELKSLDERLAELRRQGNVGGSIARIWLDGPATKVRVSYLLPDVTWTPAYSLRSERQGMAELAIQAVLRGLGRADTVLVVPAARSEADGIAPLAVRDEDAPLIGWQLPVIREAIGGGVPAAITLGLKNSSTLRLPAGELTCYRQGEYLGGVRFPGAEPDGAFEVVCGR
jgi:hypothetical protein